jgi:Domain of unknown function (DUF4157)
VTAVREASEAVHAPPVAAPERTPAPRRSESGGSGPVRRAPRGGEQLRPSAVAAVPAEVAPPVVHDVLRSPGRTLEPGIRAEMESRFGRDLSHVRVHGGSEAAKSARAIGAQAYSVGRHVVFGEGATGRSLLAHELTHVVQHGEAGVPPGTLRLGSPHDRQEAEAARVERGGPPPWERASPAVRRKLIVSPPTAASQINGLLGSFSAGTSSFDGATGEFSIRGCNAVLAPTPGNDCVCDVINDSSRTYTVNVSKSTISMGPRKLANGSTVTAPSVSVFPATAVQNDPDIDMPDVGSPVEFGEFDATGTAQWAPYWRVLEHELCGHARLLQSGGSNVGNRKDHDATIDTENSIAVPLGQTARGHFADPRQGESFFNPAGNRSKIVFKLTDGLHYEAP